MTEAEADEVSRQGEGRGRRGFRIRKGGRLSGSEEALRHVFALTDGVGNSEEISPAIAS